jgi:hypothetical protein
MGEGSFVNRRINVSVNSIPAFDVYTTGFGQTVQCHPEQRCQGKWCVIHRPRPGAWSQWPTYWDNEGKRMYRQCGHMLMHPAVEDIAHEGEAWQWAAWQRMHDCCGCPCVPMASNVIDGEWFEARGELGA